MRALRGASRAFRSCRCDTLSGFGPSRRASAASRRDMASLAKSASRSLPSMR